MGDRVGNIPTVLFLVQEWRDWTGRGYHVLRDDASRGETSIVDTIDGAQNFSLALARARELADLEEAD